MKRHLTLAAALAAITLTALTGTPAYAEEEKPEFSTLSQLDEALALITIYETDATFRDLVEFFNGSLTRVSENVKTKYDLEDSGNKLVILNAILAARSPVTTWSDSRYRNKMATITRHNEVIKQKLDAVGEVFGQAFKSAIERLSTDERTMLGAAIWMSDLYAKALEAEGCEAVSPPATHLIALGALQSELGVLMAAEEANRDQPKIDEKQAEILAKIRMIYDTEWRCNGADVDFESDVEKALASLPADDKVNAEPYMSKAKAAKEGKKFLYLWGALQALPKARRDFLTMTPSRGIKGLGTGSPPATPIPEGTPRLIDDGEGPRVSTTACSGDLCKEEALDPSLIDSILNSFGFGGGGGGNITGIKLELSGIWAASLSNPSSQSGNGLGGFSLGISRKFVLGQRFAVSPTASVGWIRVSGESSRRNFDSDNRNAAIVTGGARGYFHVSNGWSVYGVGQGVILPGRGFLAGIGAEKAFSRATVALEADYLFIPHTGVSSGSRWNQDTGEVEINGVGLSVRVGF